MKTIRVGFAAVVGAVIGALAQKKCMQIKVTGAEAVGEKYFSYYQLQNRWLSSRNEGKKTADFFTEEGISTVAIYGLGAFADRLVDELSNSNIKILYGIDRDASCTNSRLEAVYSPDERLPEVDAIVITPFCSAREIEEMLKQRCQYRLLALDQIIYSL